MNESKRTSQVLKRFRELYPDGVAWKFNDRVGRSRPDALFIHDNSVAFVEFKMPKNDLTPGQRLELQTLARAHPRVYLAYFRPDRMISVSHYPGVRAYEYSIDDFCRFVS